MHVYQDGLCISWPIPPFSFLLFVCWRLGSGIAFFYNYEVPFFAIEHSVCALKLSLLGPWRYHECRKTLYQLVTRDLFPFLAFFFFSFSFFEAKCVRTSTGRDARRQN